jgi:hypothetical protein
MRPLLLLAALALLAPACAAHGPQVVRPASSEEKAAGFGQLEKLVGTWETADEHGRTIVASEFALTSGGSVVREIMLPGSPHEMTNVFHLDGPELLVTHYCAGGNQPRMRARNVAPGRLDFGFDGVTNLTEEGTYMGELSLVMKDADTLEEHWTDFDKGVKQPELVFVLHRRK